MDLRAALIFLVLDFMGLLLVMGAIGFVRRLKMSSPRSFRSMLVGLCLLLMGAGGWRLEGQG